MPISASVFFEGVGVDDARVEVQLHVDQRRRQIFDRGEALVERVRLLDLVNQRRRHRLARLVVAGELFEHRPGQQPILVHLARIFNEVALRAAERVVNLGQQRVDRMAEFMELGRGVVEA